MTNTYAINVVRGKEFDTEAELQKLGLHPWVPRRLDSRYVKEKREAVWYDRPYVGKLIFCVIPAIYWRDVVKAKHVIGKPVELSRLDIEGIPSAFIKTPDGGGIYRPARPGLKDFQKAVEAEYADAERLRDVSGYQCQYEAGQALMLLSGAFEGFPATFKGVIRRAFDDYPRLKVDVAIFGRETSVEVDPDHVRAVG